MRITFRSESRPFLDMGSTQSIVGDDHTLLGHVMHQAESYMCEVARLTAPYMDPDWERAEEVARTVSLGPDDAKYVRVAKFPVMSQALATSGPLAHLTGANVDVCTGLIETAIDQVLLFGRVAEPDGFGNVKTSALSLDKTTVRCISAYNQETYAMPLGECPSAVACALVGQYCGVDVTDGRGSESDLHNLVRDWNDHLRHVQEYEAESGSTVE